MFIHLLGLYLMACATFSLTLNTIAFVYSTLKWFETSTCMVIPMGLPSSFAQHCLKNPFM